VSRFLDNKVGDQLKIAVVESRKKINIFSGRNTRMPLSLEERDRRYRAVRSIMQTKNIAALLVGSNAMSPGHVRYFSNYPPHSGYAYVIFHKDEGPSQFVRSKIQEQVAEKGWVPNSRFSSNYQEALVARLKELKVENQTIGLVGVENIPFKMYEHLRKELPSANFTDVTQDIFDLRMIKSEEEQGFARECARITDQLFQRIKEVARPGITEYDVYAEMDYFLRKHRCEGSFNLVASGLFPVAPFIVPSERVMNPEDSFMAELTPRYQGYYTQLTAVHPLREPSPKMKSLLDIAFASQKEGLKALKPGNRACDVALAVKAAIEKAGYAMPYRAGHSMGHEHTEPPAVTVDDRTILRPGMTLVIHPCVMDKNRDGVFLGDSYIVTGTGWERLNSTFSTEKYSQ
jgi:Xaa-Pro aminopeptidase